MTFTDRDGKVWTDVVTCADHGIIGTDLEMMHCPQCGRVLCERSASQAEIMQARARAALRTRVAPGVAERFERVRAQYGAPQ
jgi:hypothetical protein